MENQSDKSVHRVLQKAWRGLNELKFVSLGLGLVGAGVTAYLSLRASPALNTLDWLPRGVAQWADAHPRFDNFPAFGLVSLLFFTVTSTAAQFLIVLGALCLFNIGLEVAQLFMPQRHCDVWDIFWGCAGALTAGLVVAGLKCLCKPCLAAPCITKLK